MRETHWSSRTGKSGACEQKQHRTTPVTVGLRRVGPSQRKGDRRFRGMGQTLVTLRAFVDEVHAATWSGLHSMTKSSTGPRSDSACSKSILPADSVAFGPSGLRGCWCSTRRPQRKAKRGTGTSPFLLPHQSKSNVGGVPIGASEAVPRALLHSAREELSTSAMPENSRVTREAVEALLARGRRGGVGFWTQRANFHLGQQTQAHWARRC